MESKKTLMKCFSFCLVALFPAVLVPTAASAQRKIGYINFDELVAVMRETKEARQTMKAYADSLGRVDNGIMQDFFARRNAFFKDSASMDATTKEAHRKVLQKIIQDEGKFKGDAKSQLDSVQQTLTFAIATKAQEAVTTTAKANGYTYVFRNVIIAPEADDLLPLVKKQLGLDTK